VRQIIKMIHGSFLYGTNVETSDRDYKAVHIPDGKDILLQRAPNSIRNGSYEERNQPGQEDTNSLSLQHFLKLLCQGQTEPLDMIFTPKAFWTNEPGEEWLEILSHRKKFLSAHIKVCLGFSRGQTRKYAIKADLFKALENAYHYFSNALNVSLKPPNARVSELDYLEEFANNNFASYLEDVTLANGGVVTHLCVCDVRVPITASIREAYEIYKRSFKNYGERVQRAANLDSKDWKALMHALRVVEQTLELLTTRKITFPRPNADYLRQVRQGEVSYDKVIDQVEETIVRVEEASKKSSLPKEADAELAEELVLRHYRKAVQQLG